MFTFHSPYVYTIFSGRGNFHSKAPRPYPHSQNRIIESKITSKSVRLESQMSLTKCQVMDMSGLISHFFGSFWSGLNCEIGVYSKVTELIHLYDGNIAVENVILNELEVREFPCSLICKESHQVFILIFIQKRPQFLYCQCFYPGYEDALVKSVSLHTPSVMAFLLFLIGF